MNPTPEQLAQWAREAQIAFCLCKYSSYELALVTRAMAEQAEADAKLCVADKLIDTPTVNETRGVNKCAAAIRANAPKVTT